MAENIDIGIYFCRYCLELAFRTLNITNYEKSVIDMRDKNKIFILFLRLDTHLTYSMATL
jgi:hypothetical protein